MSEGLTFTVEADTALAYSQLAAFKGAHDKAVAEMASDRQVVIRGIREGMRMTQQMITAYRQAVSIFGGTIDPFFDAILTMVSATFSMMISVAAAYSSTIVGAPIGAVIAGIAIAFNILTWAKLMASQAEIMASIGKMNQQIATQSYGRLTGMSF